MSVYNVNTYSIIYWCFIVFIATCFGHTAGEINYAKAVNRVEAGQRTTRNLTQPHIHTAVTHNLYSQCTEIRDLVWQYIVVI
jgi:hypothetical protein